MINLKKSIPRRSFLRGAGAAISLPFLGAMVPSFSSQAATSSLQSRRVGFVYVPHGMVMTDTVDWWTPAQAGRDFTFTPTLQPLERFREHVSVVSNLVGAEGAGQHAGAAAAWLTDAYPKKTRGGTVEAAISIDQVIAQQVGKETPLPSVQLGIEDISGLVGFDHCGYSCTYLNTISWASPTTPLAPIRRPRTVFEQMFGASASPQQRMERIQQRRSIVDGVTETSSRLQHILDAADRRRVAQYLADIREVEQRIERAEQRTGVKAAHDQGIPEAYGEHVGIMFELMHLAYQADITRVFSFMMAREMSNLSYPQAGVAEPHHAISHHQNAAETMAKLGCVNRYHVELFADFVAKLAATPDGDGSLLDHTLLMYGSGMSNGNDHDKSQLPIALVGGLVKGNRHIKAGNEGTPVGDLHVDIARPMGVQLDKFGERSHGGGVGLS